MALWARPTKSGQDKFNLKCSIHYNRDNKPRIYIFKESMDTLITLVKPYFINSMLYKLNLSYDNK